MREISVKMWKVTPEEAIRLPNGTQLIEYDPHSKRVSVKRADHCLYDFSCVYLLSDERVADGFAGTAEPNNDRHGGKPSR